MRWAERLSAFDFDVEYVRGMDNVIADTLSQLPLPSSGYALPEISCDVTLKRIMGKGLTLSELQTMTAEDETLKAVLGYVQTQWMPKQSNPAAAASSYCGQSVCLPSISMWSMCGAWTMSLWMCCHGCLCQAQSMPCLRSAAM